MTPSHNWSNVYTDMTVSVNKELLNTKVVREVLALTSSGDFSEGSRLPAERVLCERFGVSRGTIRQALCDLEEMGIIETRPGSGSYVKKLSMQKLPEDILPPDSNKISLSDILIARKAIESAAIELEHWACVPIAAPGIRRMVSAKGEKDYRCKNTPTCILAQKPGAVNLSGKMARPRRADLLYSV